MADLAKGFPRPKDWRDALQRAWRGRSLHLAYLVKYHLESIPDDVQRDLAEWIADKTKRPGRPVALSKSQARQVRDWYEALTAPRVDGDPQGFPKKKNLALDLIANAKGVGRGTIRDVVKPRKTYSKPWDWDAEIRDEFSAHKRKK